MEVATEKTELPVSSLQGGNPPIRLNIHISLMLRKKIKKNRAEKQLKI